MGQNLKRLPIPAALNLGTANFCCRLLFTSRSKLKEQNWKQRVGHINCLAGLLVMSKVLCSLKTLHKSVTVSTLIIGRGKIGDDKVN